MTSTIAFSPNAIDSVLTNIPQHKNLKSWGGVVCEQGIKESQFVENLCVRRSRASVDHIWEEKQQVKNRWFRVSMSSPQNTQLPLAPTFHLINRSPVASRLWIAIQVVKEYLGVEIGNQTPLCQAQFGFPFRIKFQVTCEENLPLKESLVYLHRGLSLLGGLVRWRIESISSSILFKTSTRCLRLQWVVMTSATEHWEEIPIYFP